MNWKCCWKRRWDEVKSLLSEQIFSMCQKKLGKFQFHSNTIFLQPLPQFSHVDGAMCLIFLYFPRKKVKDS